MIKIKIKNGDTMEDKIYEKYKKDSLEYAKELHSKMKMFKEDVNITGTISNKNIDLKTLLTKNGLIENSKENDEKIEEFYDYLFKLGITLGITQGKYMVIEKVKKYGVDMDKLMETDLEKIVQFNYEPSFISDLREAVLNEK